MRPWRGPTACVTFGSTGVAAAAGARRMNSPAAAHRRHREHRPSSTDWGAQLLPLEVHRDDTQDHWLAMGGRSALGVATRGGLW